MAEFIVYLVVLLFILALVTPFILSAIGLKLAYDSSKHLLLAALIIPGLALTLGVLRVLGKKEVAEKASEVLGLKG